jgi:hypothetical protein
LLAGGSRTIWLLEPTVTRALVNVTPLTQAVEFSRAENAESAEMEIECNATNGKPLTCSNLNYRKCVFSLRPPRLCAILSFRVS